MDLWVETATHDNMAMIAGKVTTHTKTDYEKDVRGVAVKIEEQHAAANGWSELKEFEDTTIINQAHIRAKQLEQHGEPVSQIRPAGKRRGARRARPGQRERNMA